MIRLDEVYSYFVVNNTPPKLRVQLAFIVMEGVVVH